jgi:hypothetical protein
MVRREGNSVGSWKYSNGPGFLYLVAAGMLFVTILAWRAGQSWRWFAMIFFVLVMAFLLYVGQYISAVFDVDRRQIKISRRRIWKNEERDLSFDEIDTVAVVSSSSGTTNRTHKVILVLKSGERVQITAHPSSGKRSKQKLAQQISDTLNPYRSQPISPALDGIIKVIRKGASKGVPWNISLLSANDRVPTTHWLCQAASFRNGFLFLFPSASIGNLGTGKLSKTTRSFYRRYLGTLMIDNKNIPGFEDAIPLQKDEHSLGSRFTCLTNDPDAARTWLTKSLADKMIHWVVNSPLQAKKGEVEPHFLVTPDGIQIVFRKLYYMDEDIQKIADFGISLIEEQLN